MFCKYLVIFVLFQYFSFLLELKLSNKIDIQILKDLVTATTFNRLNINFKYSISIQQRPLSLNYEFTNKKNH